MLRGIKLFKGDMDKGTRQELIVSKSENRTLILISILASSVLIGDFVFVMKVIDIIKKL